LAAFRVVGELLPGFEERSRPVLAGVEEGSGSPGIGDGALGDVEFLARRPVGANEEVAARGSVCFERAVAVVEGLDDRFAEFVGGLGEEDARVAVGAVGEDAGSEDEVRDPLATDRPVGGGAGVLAFAAAVAAGAERNFGARRAAAQTAESDAISGTPTPPREPSNVTR
jgi:hypothetical protein